MAINHSGFKHRVMSKKAVARVKKNEAELARRLKQEAPERKHTYTLPSVRTTARITIRKPGTSR